MRLQKVHFERRLTTSHGLACWCHDVEDGTGLVWVILWRKQNECMAQHGLIDECNSNCYICVIGEVKDYYGVHEIIVFNVWPVSSGNEVTHHFWRSHIYLRKGWNMQKMRC
jgi:hypothetical protein